MLIRLTVRVLLLVLFLLASQLALPQQAGNASSPEGKTLFQQHCSKCHGEKGEGVNAILTIAGPRIQAEHNPGAVMAAMEVGPSHMPSFARVLSVEQMNSVADYVTKNLASIPLTGGNASEGGKLFREYCAPCHRTAVRGGALGYVGTNAPNLSEKSAAIIAGAIRWGPGPMPAFPRSVLDDKQLASIVEYVKFVQHPPSPGGSPLHWYGPVAEGFVAWVVLFGVIALTGWIERGGKG
jgi:ubiquinol-cytochrome c reductase cytochrome c subunit